MRHLSVTFEEISGREITEELRKGDIIQVYTGGQVAMVIRRVSRRKVRIEMRTPLTTTDEKTLTDWLRKLQSRSPSGLG